MRQTIALAIALVYVAAACAQNPGPSVTGAVASSGGGGGGPSIVNSKCALSNGGSTVVIPLGLSGATCAAVIVVAHTGTYSVTDNSSTTYTADTQNTAVLSQWFYAPITGSSGYTFTMTGLTGDNYMGACVIGMSNLSCTQVYLNTFVSGGGTTFTSTTYTPASGTPTIALGALAVSCCQSVTAFSQDQGTVPSGTAGFASNLSVGIVSVGFGYLSESSGGVAYAPTSTIAPAQYSGTQNIFFK